MFKVGDVCKVIKQRDSCPSGTIVKLVHLNRTKNWVVELPANTNYAHQGGIVGNENKYYFLHEDEFVIDYERRIVKLLQRIDEGEA